MVRALISNYLLLQTAAVVLGILQCLVQDANVLPLLLKRGPLRRQFYVLPFFG